MDRQEINLLLETFLKVDLDVFRKYGLADEESDVIYNAANSQVEDVYGNSSFVEGDDDDEFLVHIPLVDNLEDKWHVAHYINLLANVGYKTLIKEMHDKLRSIFNEHSWVNERWNIHIKDIVIETVPSITGYLITIYHDVSIIDENVFSQGYEHMKKMIDK